MQELISPQLIENKIYIIRNQKVMLDSDLALLYGVETKVLNQAVNRNIQRFPEDFMFKLNDNEWDFLRSQIVTSKEGKGGRRYNPCVFTEHGVLMLANVLNSQRAVSVSIQIVRVFAKIRQIAAEYRDIPQRLAEIEKLFLLYMEKNDERVDEIIVILNNLLQSPSETKRIGFNANH